MQAVLKNGEQNTVTGVFVFMSTFLVIGASSGIGQALAQQLIAEGHRVVGTWNEHPQSTGGMEWHPLNVLDEQADFSFLPDSLDGIAYCPGAIQLKPFGRARPEDFRSDYELQVIGAVRAIQAALPALKKSGNASVVLFSTVAVQSGFGFHSIVSASKGAIEGMARALAAELAPAIRVNVVAPSLTDTPLAAQILSNEERRAANALKHPLRRLGEAADIASAAKYLLSKESAWVTGQVLHVDGGMGALR